MMGNALSGFAMSLLVLDYTASPLLYAAYIAIFTLPQVIMPIFSGAILDRFSRKKMIWSLDFLSAGLYALVALLIGSGWFSFPVFAVYCFLLGSINSIYTVAYQSFYPLLIPEGFYSKAYSVSSILTNVSEVMVPVATVVYKSFGITPLLICNAVSFFIAAVCETRIRTDEAYLQGRKVSAAKSGRLLLADLKEGVKYLIGERGLLAITMFFVFSNMSGGVASVVQLPFFRGNFENGEYIFILVCGMITVGRVIGGFIHYRIRFPVYAKYAISMFVYIVTCLSDGIFMYCAIPVMMVLCFIRGILGVTSYTIRIASVSNYVPDEMKGRYNGAFNMLTTTGSLAGEMAAGALMLALPGRTVQLIAMLLCALSAVVIIGGNKAAVADIYNREQ